VLESVAGTAKRYEILFGVISGSTAKLLVVHLEIARGPAPLTLPSVTLQNLLAESSIRLSFKAQSVDSRSHLVHDACRVISEMNVCFSDPGKNLKNRNADCSRISGF
jgi:hypothetical protein